MGQVVRHPQPDLDLLDMAARVDPYATLEFMKVDEDWLEWQGAIVRSRFLGRNANLFPGDLDDLLVHAADAAGCTVEDLLHR